METLIGILTALADWLILALLVVWFTMDRFNIYFRKQP